MWSIKSILNLCFGADGELTPLSDVYLEHATSTAAGCIKPIEPSSVNRTQILKVEHEIVFTISVPGEENVERLTFNELQDKLVNLNALINYFRETTPPTGFDIEAVWRDEGFVSSATRFIINRDKVNPTLLSWQELMKKPLGFSALHRYFHGHC